MTELEKMQRAKMYIDKLSQGVNPLTDEEVSDGDCINNVRISRCFFYVSEILGKVIENGGEIKSTAKSSYGKIPFTVSDEDLGFYPYSRKPVSISEITAALNNLALKDGMKKLTTTVITDWLLQSGILTVIKRKDGSNSRTPTETGLNIGLRVEGKNGAYGYYETVLYNLDAQHFIIDNFQAILQYHSSLTELKNSEWDDEQDAYLKELFYSDSTLTDMAKSMKRTTSQIKRRLKTILPQEDIGGGEQ